MPFERFVETGRVAYVSNGPNKGKLISIVDIIDQNRVLVDGPTSEIPRGQMRLSDLHLTKFRIKFPFTANSTIVKKAWTDAEIDAKWQQTMWAKKVEAKKKRAELSDFDRFKLRRAKRVRNSLRTTAFFRIKKGTKKEKPTKGKPAAKKTQKAKK